AGVEQQRAIRKYRPRSKEVSDKKGPQIDREYERLIRFPFDRVQRRPARAGKGVETVSLERAGIESGRRAHPVFDLVHHRQTVRAGKRSEIDRLEKMVPAE